MDGGHLRNDSWGLQNKADPGPWWVESSRATAEAGVVVFLFTAGEQMEGNRPGRADGSGPTG